MHKTRSQNTRSLESSVQYIKGVGEKRAEQLKKIDIATVEDLLFYFPRRYLDRSTITRIKDLRSGMNTTIVGKVTSLEIVRGRRPRAVALINDDTGFVKCVWFNRVHYWGKLFEADEWVAFSGKVTAYGGLQMVHPEFDRLSEDGSGQFLHTGAIIPLYPSSESLSRLGLDSRGFRRILKHALEYFLPSVEEYLPAALLRRRGLMGLADALQQIHFPSDNTQLENARRRLIFDEFFFLELMLAARKKKSRRENPGISFELVGDRTKHVLENLGFELTEAQKKVLRQIRGDMKKDEPMNRLLQGDVGSGKTIVALISMLIAVENHYQAAIMAPTEILAEQHYLVLKDYLQPLDVKVVLLIGGQSAEERTRVLEAITSGDANIVVGTHALIQEGVSFSRLGFIVIDEQHRFGVLQRASLKIKGFSPDMLVMTATPIPRTLAMTVYGDLDVSVLDEMPEGRKEIKTYWRSYDKRAEIYQWVKEKVQEGEQAYVVFPLVEESEKIDLKAAKESWAQLSTGLFEEIPMGLLHGRLSSEEKDSIMTAFKRGEYKVLVSTTVIEVGVDVPNATIMVVEHAERFGLTQLHQLRGRVGRGGQQSYCILIDYPPLTAEARARLHAMVETTDGFKIAETDLSIRGPGEFFGTRQHGLPALRIANIIENADILDEARREAFTLFESDTWSKRNEITGVKDFFKRHYEEKLGFAEIA